jgi:hypothetical protein
LIPAGPAAASLYSPNLREKVFSEVAPDFVALHTRLR